MTFEEILDQAIAMLQRRGRVTYRLLKRQFQLDDDTLADLLAELRYAHRKAISEDEQGIVWMGGAAVFPTPPPPALDVYVPNLLRMKRFHGVRAGKAHEYSLILSIGKARSILVVCQLPNGGVRASADPYATCPHPGPLDRQALSAPPQRSVCQHHPDLLQRLQGRADTNHDRLNTATELAASRTPQVAIASDNR